MKNATIIVHFESEKLDALSYHMSKKESNLQDELNDTIQKLYEKYVPQTTREYIEDKLKRDATVKERTNRSIRRPSPSEVE